MGQGGEHCCFDGWAAADARRARRGKRVRGITRDLVEALDAVGLFGRTVLDLGCGAGGLTVETVVRGASRATGLDLSRTAVEEATRLSAESGTSERTSFSAGDASVEPLERHDVVVLNRVICCYPEVERLLANSISAASSVYAFSAPPSSGWRGVLARALVRASNLWYALRESKFQGFRTYVHDLGELDRGIRANGFRMVASRRRLAWDLRVYARPELGERELLATAGASVTAPVG